MRCDDCGREFANDELNGVYETGGRDRRVHIPSCERPTRVDPDTLQPRLR
ncbi:hypothetical protein SEA_EBONY_72 [Mycobacterium phage Ebony]|nr:hypothetical protein SEA_EBONY_72 [Mycobacterium phage Ebony]